MDFALILEGKLDTFIEVKWSDATISPSLKYYADKLKPRQAIQIVASLKKPYSHGQIRVMGPSDFFKECLKMTL